MNALSVIQSEGKRDTQKKKSEKKKEEKKHRSKNAFDPGKRNYMYLYRDIHTYIDLDIYGYIDRYAA